MLCQLGKKRLVVQQSKKLRITVFQAVIAELGERQTEDLKVPGSIPGRGILFYLIPCEFPLSNWNEHTVYEAITEAKERNLSNRDSSVGRASD